MDHKKNVKKYLLLTLLLLSCATLLLVIYVSKTLPNKSIDPSARVLSKSTLMPPTTTTTTDTLITTKETSVVSDIKESITSTTSNETNITESTRVKNEIVRESPIVDITPELKFSVPLAGKTIQARIDIQGEVALARNVEFYLIPENSNTKKYIGTAIKQSDTSWKFNFDSKNFPNGSFYLIAKIENAYGSYESGKIKITINNPIVAENPEKNEAITQPENLAQKNLAPESPQAQTVNYNDQTASEWQKKYFGNGICQKESFCGGNADPDNDGINNNEEFRYNTNPLNPDTDGDGYIDGDEIRNRFNPLKYSPGDGSDKIIFENPKEKGEVKNNLYKITNIESVNINNENKIKLTGKGLPNSFITIYVYSSLPIILTVKTDENGDWSYILDKQLDDGDHEVYVAITDNTGKITAKSEPLPFVNVAGAVSLKDSNSHIEASMPPLQNRANSDMLLILAITLLSLGLVFSIISLGVAYKASKKKL